MIRLVDEGVPFAIDGDDRRHLLRVLGGYVEHRETGLVVWSLVGHLLLPSGTHLVIRSAKASTAQLLAWTSYVDPSLRDLRNVRMLPEAAQEGDVAGALARLFCEELLSVCGAHGQVRRYRKLAVETATLRGSIDFARLARSGGNLSRVPCIVWERLPLTPLNKLLRAAIDIVHRAPLLRAAAGAALAQLRSLFVDVPSAVDPDLLAGRKALERDELPFGMVCALARLLIRGRGLLDGLDTRGVGFLVALDALFERAVVRALDEAGFNGIAKAPAVYHRVNGAGAIAGNGALELDYFIPGIDGSAVVVDAKYKRHVSPANLQQMVAYCHLMGAARAVLIFPKGHIADTRTYFFPRHASGDGVSVDVLGFDTSAKTVAEWRTAGAQLATDLRRLAS